MSNNDKKLGLKFYVLLICEILMVIGAAYISTLCTKYHEHVITSGDVERSIAIKKLDPNGILAQKERSQIGQTVWLPNVTEEQDQY